MKTMKIKKRMIRKKDDRKKALSLLLAVVLIAGLMPLTTQPVYGAVATVVTITTNNGQQILNSTYPYLVNGENEATGTLGVGGCTAYFDVSTGTLTLQDHTGGQIVSSSLGIDLDFTLKLIGANSVNGEIRNGSQGGDITITADNPASLQITNKASSTVSVYGIYTYYPTIDRDATITIGGKAKVTIDVENTHASDGNCFGICARMGVFIEDEASVSVTAISQNAASTFPVAYGIYSESAGLTFNTSGNISVDCASGPIATQKHSALRGNPYTLTGLNKMTLKWGAAGYECTGTLTPPTQYAYNKGKLGGVNCSVTQSGIGQVRALTIISGKNDFGRGSGQYFAGDTVNLTANPITGLTFKNWQAAGGSFGDANSASTTYTMPATDATVTATYHFFATPPTFTKTGTDKGDISFQLSAEPQQAPRLVAATGDETNIVGGQYFTQTADPQSKTVQNGTGPYAVPNGHYRIAAEYNNIWRFSDVFAVDYSGGTVSVTSVSVKTPPTKTTYTAGETLDLAGLAVTLNKSDGSTEDVAFADFATKGITASPTQGTSLTTANTTVTLTHTVSGKSVNQPITVNIPVTITSVSVTPKTVSVQKGNTQNFTANVAGTGAFDNTVSWSVSGANHASTQISNAGILTVAAAETAPTLTVTATANGDGTKKDTATVTVTNTPPTTYALTVNNGTDNTGASPYVAGAAVSITANSPATGKRFKNWTASGGGSFADASSATTTYTMPGNAATVTANYENIPITITSVSVTPKTVSVQKGNTQNFTATVAGTGAFNNTVSWSVTGGIAGTSINSSGLLTVAAGETASTLTVTATANGDGTKTDTATVTVTNTPPTTYALTVTNGTDNTGASPYVAGAAVSITANSPATGKRFKNWTASGGGSFADASSATTTYTMPGNAATVTANYENIPVTITSVSVTPKTVSVQKGNTQNFTANVAGTGAFDNTVTWSVTGANHASTQISNTGILTVATAETASTLTVTATANGDTGKKDTATVTIQKATPSGTPTYTKITSSGKTLADAALGKGTITLAGTINWNDATTTVVTANTAYGWTFTPTDTTNYNSLTGSITPYPVTTSPPSGGGGGGGYTPPVTPKPIEVAKDIKNGTIASNLKEAKPGDTVTLTPKPDTGYEIKSIKVTDKNGKPIKVTQNTDGTFSFKMPDTTVTIEAEFVPLAPPPNIADYTDISPEIWFYPSVAYVIENKLMVGTAKDQFSPNAETSRSMIVTILYRLAGTPEITTASKFSDVTAGKWYTDAVTWAAQNKVVGGFPDGSFKPDTALSREQLVTILYNFAKLKGYDTSGTELSAFHDANQVAGYALPAMQWAIKHGIVNGIGEDLISPASTATRAQMAAILERYIEDFAK